MSLEPLSIRNPELGFRLDPGEPGMLRSARASEATLRVTAQEQRNLARLESEAIMEGRVIVYSGIHYGKSFAGGFMTTTDGLTTVVSRAPRPNITETESARPSRDNRPPAPAAGESEAPAAETAAPAAAAETGESDRTLAARADQLRAELQRLESPGFGMPIENAAPAFAPGAPVFAKATPGETAGRPAAAGNDPLRPLADAAATTRRAMDEGRAREVESELRRVEFERLARRMGFAGGGASAPATTPANVAEPVAVPA